jgi:hypothetical protein
MEPAKTSWRLNANTSTVVRDIEETGGVRWHVEASARLQVATWTHGYPTLSSLTPLQASKGEPHPMPSTQLNFRRPDSEVIAFN